ncbi:MAG TPA: DUF2459 domain-containing protein [Candidatus Binatia bacterium]|nr:DUF2459 domain-containing protein [Candidatus Binatia bacterium]
MLFSCAARFQRFKPAALLALILACAAPAAAANEWACASDEKLCRSAVVVHDSWHAGIVLSRNDLSSTAFPELADFPAARFIEFSWGDKDYFPDPESGFSMALKAAFWSRGSVLHLVGFTDDIKQMYPKAEIVEFRLTPSAFNRLSSFLSQSFMRANSTARSQALPGLYSYSRFYPSVGKFSLLNTCNTWVAQALESAGIPVSPSRVITAGQLAEQMEKVKAPQ